jgi:hypothetical protein
MKKFLIFAGWLVASALFTPVFWAIVAFLGGYHNY